MAGKVKDLEKMTEGQLLRELVRRFASYDRARDRYVGFLQRKLARAGVDYETAPGWERIHADQDEKFCRVREVCRIVKGDPDYMWC